MKAYYSKVSENPLIPKSIALQVSGRLGNQLFEWSYAHELSSIFNCKVHPFVDSTHFSGEQESIFEDEVFQCDSISWQRKRNFLGYVLQILDKIHSRSPRAALRIEKIFKISRQMDAYVINSIPFTPKLVTGFFINYQHVQGNKRHLFGHLEEKFREIETDPKLVSFFEIGKYQAVHVRRGDFVALRDTFGLLDPAWYKANLDSSLPLVFATDDLEGSKNIINELKPAVILDPISWNAWQTLLVLSRAERLVMANSTFSWWAGFCSVMSGNKAIFPSPFYKSEPWKDGVLKFDDFTSVRSTFEA